MSGRYLEIDVHRELPAVLDGLIKAVLREQPKDIIRFCAEHFEQKDREGKDQPQSNTGIPGVSSMMTMEDVIVKYFGRKP